MFTPPALYLALPTFLVSLAFSIGESHDSSPSFHVIQSLMFSCLTLLFSDLCLKFFIKYDKSTVLPSGEQKPGEIINVVSTLGFLVLPLTSYFIANSLLGPLRSAALLCCLLITKNNDIGNDHGYIKYQGFVVLGLSFIIDLFTSTHNLDNTLIGYPLLLTAYTILFNPFQILKIQNSINKLPDINVLIALTLISLMPFLLICLPIYNIKMLLVSVLSLVVTLISSIDIEKLHRSKTKALTSFIDIKLADNYKLKYFMFNVILVFVYFLNIGLISEINSFRKTLYEFLISHWVLIISNLSFILILFQQKEERSESEATNDISEKIDNTSMTFTGLVIHLFFAEESKSIFNFLLLNLAFMFIQLLYSFRSKSLSLLSDSLHMLLDCLSLFFGLMASVIATKNKESPSPKFPFGLSRIETLAGFTNGSLLLGIVFGIFNESFQRLFSPIALENTTELLIVSFLGLLVNLVGIFAFNHGDTHGGHGHSHGHSHSHLNPFSCKEEKKDIHVEEEHKHQHNDSHDNEHSKECKLDHDNEHKHSHSEHKHEHSHSEHSHSASLDEHPESSECDEELNDNMHGIFLHILADTLGSVGVIISTIIVKLTGWTLVDPITSMLIASLILISAIPLLKSSSSNLLLSVPNKSEKELQYVLGEVLKIKGVKSYTTPRFWPQEGSSTKLVGYLHVQFFKSENSIGIRSKVEKLFETSKVVNKVYLQLENEVDDCWCRRDGIFGTL